MPESTNCALKVVNKHVQLQNFIHNCGVIVIEMTSVLTIIMGHFSLKI